MATLSSLLRETADSLRARTKSAKEAETLPDPAALDREEAARFVARLAQTPLATLATLPAGLSARAASLDHDLSALAHAQYGAVLEAHTAAAAAGAAAARAAAALAAFNDAAAGLGTAATAFEARAAAMRARRARLLRVHARLPDIQEWLDAPALADACVRAGLWGEALDVAARLVDVHRRCTGADAALLRHLLVQVLNVLGVLRARVLAALRARGLRLPGAVRALATLRRVRQTAALYARACGPSATTDALQQLSERNCAYLFLMARWQCMRGELEMVEGLLIGAGVGMGRGDRSEQSERSEDQKKELEWDLIDPPPPSDTQSDEERTQYTKKWIELWREFVSESMTIYQEVYLKTGIEDVTPLALFTSHALDLLRRVLSQCIARISATASLSSILTQLKYCSLAFSRHGYDFMDAYRLQELIEDRVAYIVISEWRGGARKLSQELSSNAPLHTWLTAPESLTAVINTALPAADPNSSSWHHQPSPSLALVPPLARFVNTYATALNALRLLPGVRIYPHLLAALIRLAEDSTASIATFYRRHTHTTDAQHKQLVVFVVVAFARLVLPWCEGGLVYGVYEQLQQGARPTPVLKDAISRTEALVGPPSTETPAEDTEEHAKVVLEDIGEAHPIPDHVTNVEDVEGEVVTAGEV